MSDDAAYGFAGEAQGEDLNNIQFLVDMEMARISTMKLVKVVAVYPGTYDSQTNGTPTTVDVKPMVDSVDSQGNRTAHGTIYGIISARHHAGGNAVMSDPQVGDVGIHMAMDRDISSLFANNGAQSAPGSSRRFDLADGVYHGGVWTPKPTNFVDLRGGNVKVTTQGNITHTAQGDITHTATGNIILTGKQLQFGGGSGNDDIFIKPTSGKKVYLGGDPADGGTFDKVSTPSGPSENVYALVSGTP